MVVLLALAGCLLISDDAIDAKVGVGVVTDPETGVEADTQDDSSVSDEDGDGFTVGMGDCDDDNANVNPGAIEDCATTVDDDCSGTENDPDALGCIPFYEDDDGDGFGGSVAACLCAATGSYPSVTSDDCDDSEALMHPGGTEVCGDELDNDCDGGPGPCVPASSSLSAAIEYVGESTTDYAGSSVAGVGDANQDGYDDFIVGAPYNDEYAGAAYIVFGTAIPGASSLASAVRYAGEGPGRFFGSAVAGAGDVDGDGFDDVLIGSPGLGAGRAYLFLGSNDLSASSLSSAVEYSGESFNDSAGNAVSGAGDVNADGYSDLVIGAMNNDPSGASYLVLGSAAPTSVGLSSAFKYSGEHGGDFAGSGVAGAGDVDGDGFDDVLVGSYCARANEGAGYLLLGGPDPMSGSLASSVIFTGEVAGDYAGKSVAGAGDVDGDGYDDILIGAYDNDDGGGNAGAAYLVLGSSAPASRSLSDGVEYMGAHDSDYAGTSVAGAGDVDGDGFDDLLVGATSNDDGGSDAGAAYLVLGVAAPASTTLSTVVEYAGASANDYAGRSLSGAGDVNADGHVDILVGADRYPNEVGVAYLILGVGI